MRRRFLNRCCATAVFGMGVMGLRVTPCRAELFSLRIPELETWYGGFDGPEYREATFDFGQEFSAVQAAWLHIVATPDFPEQPQEIVYLATLDGPWWGGPPGGSGWGIVVLAPWQDLNVDILFDQVPSSVFDGEGLIGLYIDTTYVYDDLCTVSEATLWFDATSAPEPTSLAFLALGAWALTVRRR